MILEKKVVKKKCKQCGYKWEARVKNPKKCPVCQSWKWDKKRISK